MLWKNRAKVRKKMKYNELGYRDASVVEDSVVPFDERSAEGPCGISGKDIRHGE